MDVPSKYGQKLEKFSTERKEAKERTTDKRSIVNSSIDYSTKVQGNTAVNSPSEQIEDHQNRYKSIGQQELVKKERNSRLLVNAEIDECLFDWINEGLVDEKYAGFVAKACHVLGLQKVNRLAVNARNGKTPQNLFSCLLKGALNLHYKRQFQRSPMPEQTEIVRQVHTPSCVDERFDRDFDARLGD